MAENITDKNEVEIVSKNQECTVYRIQGENGDVLMTGYRVFPGVELIYNDVHTQFCNAGLQRGGRFLEINHCREGRIEVAFQNEYFYLEPGDLAIAGKDGSGHESYFPTSHYHGISIAIDLDYAPDCFTEILDDVDVSPNRLAEKFCSTSGCFVMRADNSIDHVFSELYSVRDCIRRGYFKVKVLELLLFLSGIETNQVEIEQRLYTPSQVQLAKRACRFITEHLNEKITIEHLSDLFSVSPTQLKNCFRGVYGMTVYSYIRSQKMHAAARLLHNSDRTVLDIAGEFGYDNGSKFAQAFKDVMGMTPNEYRTTKA